MESKTEKVFRTWEGWCLLKLREIGKSTMRQWAEAMGYSTSSNMTRTVKKLEKEGKLIIRGTGYIRRFTYEAKDNSNLTPI